MSKRIISLIIAIVVSVGVSFGVTYTAPLFLTQKQLIKIPTDEDLDGHKELAVELYNAANIKYKETDDVAILVNCVTTTSVATIDMPSYNYRYYIKNSSEYLAGEFSFPGEKTEALLKKFARESTMFASLKYTNADMDNMYCEKVVDPTPTMTVENGKNVYNVDWSGAVVSTEDKPIFCASQPEPFQITDMNITPETLLYAKVTHNDEQGFYTLKLILDCNNENTTSITLPKLREGFGNDTANYDSITETIEIWDDGSFKYFLSEDNWSGNKVVNMNFLIHYESTFHYDEEACDFSNYQYFDDFIAKVKALNK